MNAKNNTKNPNKPTKKTQKNCIWKARKKIETYVKNVQALLRGYRIRPLYFNFLMRLVADPSDYLKFGMGTIVSRMRNWG